MWFSVNWFFFSVSFVFLLRQDDEEKEKEEAVIVPRKSTSFYIVTVWGLNVRESFIHGFDCINTILHVKTLILISTHTHTHKLESNCVYAKSLKLFAVNRAISSSHTKSNRISFNYSFKNKSNHRYPRPHGYLFVWFKKGARFVIENRFL